MLKDAFAWGRALGIESTVGVEACGVDCSPTPAGNADPPQYPGDRTANLTEYYRGTLLHINATYQSEYFWIWSSEGWAPRSNASIPVSDPAIQGIVENFHALEQAKQETGLATKLATGGWTLGEKKTKRPASSLLLSPSICEIACEDNDLPTGSGQDNCKKNSEQEGWFVFRTGPLADLAYFDSVLPEGWVMSSINEKIGCEKRPF